jgi:hypothetical protein
MKRTLALCLAAVMLLLAAPIASAEMVLTLSG